MLASYVCLAILLAHPPPSSASPKVRLAGVQSTRTGRALALPKGDDVFHFVVFGDRTGGPPEGVKVLAQAVKDTNLLDPDLVLTVGDLIEGYSTTEPWMRQMREYRSIMDGLKAPWYPVAGNHDVYWRGEGAPPGEHESHYEEHFGPLWYWFGHKNAAFVVLYSDEGDPSTGKKGWQSAEVNQISEGQLQWLTQALEKTGTFDHVFVFIHHPRWISNYYPGTNWDAVHERLKAAGNVTAVFAGHIHRRRYEGRRDGIEYLTLGTTGGGVPFDGPTTGWMHHFDVVTVRPDRISMASIPVGQVQDIREMTPDRLDRIDALVMDSMDFTRARPIVETTGRGRGQVKFGFENPLDTSVRLNVELDADDPKWSFRPDHVHLTVPGRGSLELPLFYQRRSGLEDLQPIEVRVQAEAEVGGLVVRSPTMYRVVDPWLIPTHRPIESPPSAEPGGGSCVTLKSSTGAVRVASTDVPLPDGPFTLEAWVRSRGLEGPQNIAGKVEWSEYGLMLRDGAPVFAVVFLDGWEAARSRKRLPLGRWSHVAGVFDGKELRIYQDGELINRAPASGARRTNDVPFMVGADPSRQGRAEDSFEGDIAAVRLSRGVRYTGESFSPASLWTVDKDAILQFDFQDHLGPFVFSSTPKRQPGYLVGSIERRALCSDPTPGPDDGEQKE